MTIRVLGVAGLGAMGLAAVGLASPAAAAVVPGCGEVPAGASATVSNGVCELEFATPGAYTWTLPAGISGLYALLVGGGGGAYANGTDTGYAGSGGSVIYADYTTAHGGDVADLTVGAGGLSDPETPTNGGSSFMMLGVSALAPGGSGGGYLAAGYCIADGNFSTYVGTGDGAGGASGPDGDDCATTVGPGVNPSLGDLDSDGNAVPAAFASLNSTLGTGGQVVVDPVALPSGLAGTGWGASAQYVDPSTVPSFNATGGSGRIIYRYTLPALASTGVNSVPQLIFAGAAGVFGAAMLAFSRRRTRSES